jgi:hypothetical protein
MANTRSAAAAGALLLLLSSAVPGRAADGSTLVALVSARNESLSHYTFHMNVAMVMRHFPWLHFRMGGVGKYDRAHASYAVHFTSVPWFAKKAHDIDLSMIDPSLWDGKYDYHVVGMQGSDTIFSLKSTDGDDIKSATVAINPNSGVQWTDVTYGDGTHIHLTVGSQSIDGFLLPSALTAQVDYGKMPLSASADITDYDFDSN